MLPTPPNTYFDKPCKKELLIFWSLHVISPASASAGGRGEKRALQQQLIMLGSMTLPIGFNGPFVVGAPSSHLQQPLADTEEPDHVTGPEQPENRLVYSYSLHKLVRIDVRREQFKDQLGAAWNSTFNLQLPIFDLCRLVRTTQ